MTSMAAAITMHTSILLAVVLIFIPVSDAFWNKGEMIRLNIQNNHTNYLSIRCFSFERTEKVQHLDGGQHFNFTFRTNSLFPSQTMYNCSTNMGAFVAYRFDYFCATSSACNWRFDLNQTYLLEPISGNWRAMDYNPNYESLERGGVVEAKYTNRR